MELTVVDFFCVISSSGHHSEEFQAILPSHFFIFRGHDRHEASYDPLYWIAQLAPCLG